MKIIDLRKTVSALAAEHPELVGLMAELGFKEIVKPAMLATVGRFMTLKQGCSLRHIDYETVKATLVARGFTLQED